MKARVSARGNACSNAHWRTGPSCGIHEPIANYRWGRSTPGINIHCSRSERLERARVDDLRSRAEFSSGADNPTQGELRIRIVAQVDEPRCHVRKEPKCKSSSPARTASSAAQLQQPLSQRVIRFAAWFVTRRRPARLRPTMSKRSSGRSTTRRFCKPKPTLLMLLSMRPAAIIAMQLRR